MNSYIIKLLTFVSIYLALMIDSARCEEDKAEKYSTAVKNYIFGGSGVVTILNDVPASITYSLPEFKAKKQGLYARLKNKVSSTLNNIYEILFDRKTEDNTMPFDVNITQGTYMCQGGTCQRQPGDEQINYEDIKKKDGKIERPEENALTQKVAKLDKTEQFVKPANFIVDINREEMVEILDKGYKEKEKNS